MVKESILVWGSKKVSLVGEVSQEGVSGPGLSIQRLYHNDKCPTPARRTLERADTWESVKMEVHIPLSSKANGLLCSPTRAPPPQLLSASAFPTVSLLLCE